uniref:Uncharacterized protein n=1 Tax=Phenylobacterium glaciei TaxID=2803784 RepID=A0A974P3B1_9CAUL|nr:hypothetical protein JKL49_27370 [Phenylobacterium glaciei]
MFIAIAFGLKNALDIYFALYFFLLSQTQLSILTAVGVVASLAGVALAPRAAPGSVRNTPPSRCSSAP